MPPRTEGTKNDIAINKMFTFVDSPAVVRFVLSVGPGPTRGRFRIS